MNMKIEGNYKRRVTMGTSQFHGQKGYKADGQIWSSFEACLLNTQQHLECKHSDQ